MHIPSNKNHYLLLDAARGLAALAVFIYHLKKFVYPDIGIEYVNIFSKSYLAVDLFFLMSGLVIARSYEEKLLSGAMTFREFFWVRLLRLYPLYILGLCLGLGYVLLKWLVKHEDSGSPIELGTTFALNALFIPDFSNKEGMFFFDPAAWSLSLEWIINIIYAAFAVRFSTRILGWIAGLAAIILIGSGIYAGNLDLGWSSENFAGGFIRILYSFTVGILIYRSMIKNYMPVKINSMLLLIAIFAVLVIPMSKDTIYYDLILVVMGFPIFAYFSCFANIADNLRRVFFISGQVSYALYILHTPLIMLFGGIWKFITKTEPEDYAFISFPVIGLLIILTSYLATIIFDEPVRKYLKKFLKRN